MVTARRRARHKSAAAIKRARSELINLQSRVQAHDKMAQTAEALQWRRISVEWVREPSCHCPWRHEGI
jgi:hypothetical protein